MKKDNECVDGQCPVGIEEVRKIGLTRAEKRAIFLAIVGKTRTSANKSFSGRLEPTA